MVKRFGKNYTGIKRGCLPMDEIYDKQVKSKRKANESAEKAKFEKKKVLDDIVDKHDNPDTDTSTSDNFLDTMVFSFSNLSAFETCPYSWYLKYIERENGLDNIYGEFGTCCHRVLERFVKGEIQQDELVNTYINEFDNTVKSGNDCYDKVSNLFDTGFNYFSKCSWKNLHLDGCKVIGVEYECRFKVGDNDFIGFIDLLVQDNSGELIVIDHKSGEYPMNKSGTVKAKQKEKLESYKRQLYLYCKAVYDKFHKYPSKLVWNFFKTNDWLVIPFDETEYHNTLKWAQDLIFDIYLTVDFDSKPSFFFCHNICDYRMVCERKDEDIEK